MAKKHTPPLKRDAVAEFVVKELGGPTATARLVGIKPPSVMGWLKKGIPKPWLKYFDLAYPDLMRKARKIQNGDAVDRAAASDDTQALGGSADNEPKRKGGGSGRKTKEARA